MTSNYVSPEVNTLHAAQVVEPSKQDLDHQELKHPRGSLYTYCQLLFLEELFQENGFLEIQNFSILAGGRCPPDPLIFGWGAKAPPDSPLNGRPQHLIEAAKRCRLVQMLCFRRR